MKNVIAAPALFLLAACGGGGGSEKADPGATPCAPVFVQTFGDSTTEWQENRLQRYMDARFGSGRVVVENLGKGGTVAAQFPADRMKVGATTTANYGINDFRTGVTIDEFRAALRRNATTFMQTPNPPHDAYAPAVREVAAETGRVLIDVSAWVRAIPNWNNLVSDGVHPDPVLLDRITNEVTGPAIAAKIAADVCR